MILPYKVLAIVLSFLVPCLSSRQADEAKTARDYYERGLVHEKNKQVADALADYSKAVELDPHFIDAWFTRSSLYADRKEYAKAITDLTKVIEIKPGDYPAADYTRALQLDPKIEMVHYRRGDAYHGLRAYAKAEQDYAAAINRDPDYPNLLNSWAWQLATCPDPMFRDGKRAVEMGTKANEKFGWKIPGHVETLAAAYAEIGQFDEAIKWQKKALELLDTKGFEQRKAMQERIELYQARRPFRE